MVFILSFFVTVLYKYWFFTYYVSAEFNYAYLYIFEFYIPLFWMYAPSSKLRCHLQSSKPPVITRLFAIIIGKSPFFPVIRPLSSCLCPFFTNKPPTQCPREGNVTCPLFPVGPAALDHVPCPRRQNRDNVLFVVSVTSRLLTPLVCCNISPSVLIAHEC
jgi:hypothetical protein